MVNSTQLSAKATPSAIQGESNAQIATGMESRAQGSTPRDRYSPRLTSAGFGDCGAFGSIAFCGMADANCDGWPATTYGCDGCCIGSCWLCAMSACGITDGGNGCGAACAVD